ncbi:prepilin-type N-terminal cleavage/methylation domain-containing protein [Chitinibacter sp. FCG-7]|uniref:Prepilin-type N-terminal cleavage/methylation domain-containing protein n=1 Tax=Chitinibacter mangrovi TaxID=3153927 RepID=A0AAU7F7V1_9NEIS
MRLINFTKQQGISLIELMVSLAIGLLLISAATTIGFSSIFAGKEGIQQTNLNETLRSIITEASRDLRRAGYSKNMSLSPLFRKAYLSQNSTIKGKDAYQCIIFIYDNYDGSSASSGNGILGNEDMFGLTFKDNQVFVLLNGDTSTTTCSGSQADGWYPLNSTNKGMPKITNFYFTVDTTPTVTKNTAATPQQIGALAIGNITLYIDGDSLQSAPSGSNKFKSTNFQSTLSQTIQLRNLPVIQ